MAKSLLSVRKKKKTRVTRNEAYLVNFKYMGDEPEYKSPLTDSQYSQALNWYNMMCTTSDAREYITTWLKENGKHSEAKQLARVPDTFINSTVGWICRMLSKGYLLPFSSQGFLDRNLQESLSHAKEPVPEDNSLTPKVSIQDRIREKTHDIIGEIESIIDQNEVFSLYDYLKSNEIPAQYTTSIIQHYASWLTELIEAYEGKDEQLKEAYRHMTKKELKDRIIFFNDMINDAEKYAGVAKKIRAPRKPKKISNEKKLKNFKYQKESNDYKIASINPEKILGAQELWTFNTKYKTLSVFRAIDRGGLQVKGASIINYDEKASFTKGTGRKPEPIVDKVLKGGKIVLKKLMDELKTDKALQYRINENTILLKVV
jgi:hypothetical protein